ncbi:hypothetical protein K402DRAFT_240534 [Aulographum hederae CBS 113979]|uniref:Uncharacterized protein n=1 Tax=Aulographum hederae CBS 113979 TaxID=1176131 RepID=A0A6G1GK63_9PEZI|nr:hypothetical protein K402DRAFT_240534 [Aulographum hederae CBS 113979]
MNFWPAAVPFCLVRGCSAELAGKAGRRAREWCGRYSRGDESVETELSAWRSVLGVGQAEVDEVVVGRCLWLEVKRSNGRRWVSGERATSSTESRCGRGCGRGSSMRVLAGCGSGAMEVGMGMGMKMEMGDGGVKAKCRRHAGKFREQASGGSVPANDRA